MSNFPSWNASNIGFYVTLISKPHLAVYENDSFDRLFPNMFTLGDGGGGIIIWASCCVRDLAPSTEY